MLRHGLQLRASRELDCGIHDLPGRIACACEALTTAARRLRDMPLDELRRKDLRRGAQRTMQRCQEGFECAAQSRAPDDLHMWRRDVKYAYHQTRLMDQLMPRWARSAGPDLGTLAETLGHYQDLSVLDRVLRMQADELNIDVHLRSIRNALRATRAELATSALQLGVKTFTTTEASPGNVIELTPGA